MLLLLWFLVAEVREDEVRSARGRLDGAKEDTEDDEDLLDFLSLDGGASIASFGLGDSRERLEPPRGADEEDDCLATRVEVCWPFTKCSRR